MNWKSAGIGWWDQVHETVMGVDHLESEGIRAAARRSEGVVGQGKGDRAGGVPDSASEQHPVSL